MKRNLILFVATFAVGAIAALAFRAATFEPHASAASHGNHASSEPVAEKPQAEAAKPVNTVCAICGMAVDPSVPTAVYKGKTIGFGCRMCPSKFKSDPDHYGPYYLRNEVIEH
ncbi:MAG: hypothetical protein SFV32_10180 [Opitutaceae bacterium]|nr:hypothetical protein [Opitutaceae bacterium]